MAEVGDLVEFKKWLNSNPPERRNQRGTVTQKHADGTFDVELSSGIVSRVGNGEVDVVDGFKAGLGRAGDRLRSPSPPVQSGDDTAAMSELSLSEAPDEVGPIVLGSTTLGSGVLGDAPPASIGFGRSPLTDPPAVYASAPPSAGTAP